MAQNQFLSTSDLANLRVGRTRDQLKIIDYFTNNGCMSLSFGGMKDEDYESFVRQKMNSLNLKQRALGKIGLDEDELQEIPPVFLHGYHFDDDVKTLSKVGKDDKLRSTKYDCTWLFFSDTQVYMYAYTFDMITDAKREKTEEYFYSDITNFSTSTETVEALKVVGCSGNATRITRDYTEFGLIVPGDRFECSMSGVPNAEQAVSAMKQKLRDKKRS